MEILDLAEKLAIKIVKGKAKKLQKKCPATEIKTAEPVMLNGGKYVVGFAKTDIMPEDIFKLKKHFVAGHGMGHVAEGILDPLTASAMWIGFEDGGIIQITADVIGITGYDVNEFRKSMSDFCKETNCKNISISCTHNHAGLDTLGYWGKLPSTGRDMEYMKLFYDSLRKICREAYENRKTGELYKGSINVPEAQYDKREPMRLRDMLSRLRFVPDDGSSETWLLGFDAHPNTLGGSNRMISPDYPGYLRKTITSQKDVNVLFAIGAIAAVDPGMFSEDNLERAKKQGEVLGNAALKIDNDEKLEANITLVRQPFYVPIDNPLLALLAILKVMTSQKYGYDKGNLGLALLTEMTYIKIGNKQMLQLPGEMFPETVYGGYCDAETSATGKGAEINAKPLVEIADDKELWVFGVTNDMAGYCVAPNDFVLHETQAYLSNGKDRFDRGHYHETNSLGYLTSETIAKTFEKVMEQANSVK